MDKVALRNLVAAGVKRIRASRAHPTHQSDADSDLILDRLIQVGQAGITYEAGWLLDEVVRALLDLYRDAIPADADTMRPAAVHAERIFNVGSRVWILGGVAIRRSRFEVLKTLVLQRPVERWQSTYWLRYTVTMAARGNLDVFRGKSLIGPVSERIREKPQFLAEFDSNLDRAVNAMCQFDFLACVLVVAETKTLDDIYPSFGGYYSERTLPIIEALVSGGPARKAIGNISDEFLAEILHKLDHLTRRVFFAVNGWDGYNDRISNFIRQHRGDTHGNE